MEQINPQGPTVQLRELYSLSYDKLQWKRIQKAKKNVYICKTESLCRIAEINTTLKINYISI